MNHCRTGIKGLSSIALFLSCVLFQACSNEKTSQNPLEPEPVAVGTLEVTVRVSGTMPDPDGYALVVTVATDSVLPARNVDPEGGMVRLSDLPPGTYSARMEGLGANCSVGGIHPRSFTISAGRTTQIAFFVNCPGPGAVLVRTTTRGRDLSPGDYTVAFESASIREDRIGTNDSLLIQEEDLPAGEQWTVRLKGIPDNCFTSPNTRVLTGIPGDATTRIEFPVTCIQRSSRIAFADSGEIFLTVGSEVVNLTNHPAWDSSPSLSPDRQRVVFSTQRDGNSELYVVNADGSGLTRLTNSPGPEFVGSQAWSPDGSRIVFTSSSEGQQSSEIYVMNADGTGVVRLTQDGAYNISPAWSPDGASIAFCRFGAGFTGIDIYRMSAIDGSGIAKVASDGCSPAWSPDGSRIAYTSGVNNEFAPPSLAVIGVDGTGFMELNWGSAYAVSWSPDGSEIAFASGQFATAIWIVSFDGRAFAVPIEFRSGFDPSWR